MSAQQEIGAMSSDDLLAATHEIVQKARGSEADLLVHLGEIDERKLYLDRAYPSMFAFCMREYRFSEDVAWSRICVARTARRLPQVLEAIRTGKIHLAGLRVLGPHLTSENHRELLTEAAGKSRREIEELVARLAPQPGIPTAIRRDLPEPAGTAAVLAAGKLGAAYVFPLAGDLFKFQFSGSRACRDKLREAQDLLRHRVPNGDVGTIFELALDALIAQVKKQRFAVTNKPKNGANHRRAPVSARSKGTDGSAHPKAEGVSAHGKAGGVSAHGKAGDVSALPKEGDVSALPKAGDVSALPKAGHSPHLKTDDSLWRPKGREAPSRPKGRDASQRRLSSDLRYSEPKAGQSPRPETPGARNTSRHIPNRVKRFVYARDGGRCTFTDERGRRCSATSALEYHHMDGFARTRRHDPDRICLACRPHNQHAAAKMYGRAFMEQAKASRRVPSKITTGPPS